MHQQISNYVYFAYIDMSDLMLCHVYAAPINIDHDISIVCVPASYENCQHFLTFQDANAEICRILRRRLDPKLQVVAGKIYRLDIAIEATAKNSDELSQRRLIRYLADREVLINEQAFIIQMSTQNYPMFEARKKVTP